METNPTQTAIKTTRRRISMMDRNEAQLGAKSASLAIEISNELDYLDAHPEMDIVDVARRLSAKAPANDEMLAACAALKTLRDERTALTKRLHEVEMTHQSPATAILPVTDSVESQGLTDNQQAAVDAGLQLTDMPEPKNKQKKSEKSGLSSFIFGKGNYTLRDVALGRQPQLAH